MESEVGMNSAEYSAENEVPDGVWVDTRRAEALEWVADRAANFFSVGPKVSDEGESAVPDLLASVRAAAAAGEIDPTCVIEAVTTLVQAVCMTAGGALDEFFREFVGGQMGSLMRAEAPLAPVWDDNVVYPEFPTDPDFDDPEVNEVAVRFDADSIHRLGSMVHNLRCEPLAVVVDQGEIGLAEQWSVGAAVNALLDGWEDADLTNEQIGLLVALPVLAISELLEWMDREVIPGLSNSALAHLRAGMLRELRDRFGLEPKAAA